MKARFSSRRHLHLLEVLARAFAQLKAGRRLATATMTALVIFGAGSGFTFLAQIAAARLLGADAYGEYAIVIAWVMLAASICTLGFHVSLVRLIPAYLCCKK